MSKSLLSPTPDLAVTPDISFTLLTNQLAWPAVCELPGRIRIQMQMPSMSLRSALQLQSGQILISQHAETSDVSLCIGGIQLCWCEFAAVGERMGVRITQLV